MNLVSCGMNFLTFLLGGIVIFLVRFSGIDNSNSF
jgi:hypothetical protein